MSKKFGRGLALLARCCFAVALMSGYAFAGEEAPPWLRQAASAGAPAYDKKVPAVVLLSEQTVRVEDDGRVTTTERGAVRILSNEGRGAATGTAVYTTDTGRFKEMRAWMIRPSGQVTKYGKERVLDLAAADNDVYNEVRLKLISARDDAEPGAVFGYEWTIEDRSVFTQFDWQFQDRLPTLLSRFSITLPAGWRAEGVTFNHARVEPAVSGSTYTWQLTDMPYWEDEPLSPPVTNLVARLAVSYFPPPEKRSGPNRAFESWVDVSRWLSELSDPMSAPDDAIAAKARQLVAGAKTELERIQAIGSYVQGVNYISIQTGVGRGGGYRPHAATAVFSKSYGDCKDKANLMRAMLKAVNVSAYLVCIYAGDPTFVREEWPSPQQFNHCIIAVKVGDATEAAAVIKHPTLGRLLIFDPTDNSTPVGDLPDHEQGSLALIIAGEAGALLRMPVAPPEMNRLERQADVVLAFDGSITASIRERSQGQPAVAERRSFRGLSRPEYVKMVESWVTRGASGAKVSKVEPSDHIREGRFALDVDFTASRYGQLMQGRLLIFKPALVSRREALQLTEGSRRQPVVLDPNAYTETVKVKLPEGFDVDELPDATTLDAPFGSYRTTYEVKEGHLHFKRSLVVKAATIPVSDYTKVRSFFEKIRSAEQSNVVLAKK